MTAPQSLPEVHALDRLREAVEAALPEQRLQERHVAAALKSWRAEMESHRDESALAGPPLSDDSFRALVDFHLAYVEDLVARKHADTSAALLKDHFSRVRTLITHVEDANDGFDVDPWFGLKRQSPAPDFGPALAAIREFTLGESTEETRAAARGLFPERVANVAVPLVSADFIKDLAAFLLETGDSGREMTLALLDDVSFARDVAEKQFAPRPLVFLAGLAVRTSEHQETLKVA